MLPAFLVVQTLNLSAQEKNTATDNPTRPVVTKGYYSIGNNAAKLPQPKAAIQRETGTTHPEVAKGYHSIGTNNTKLPAQKRIKHGGTKKKAAKGYYSIEKNN